MRPLQQLGAKASIRGRIPVALAWAGTMVQYQLQAPTLRCVSSGRELKPGEVFYSVLHDTPQGLVRSDYSVEAWAGPPSDAFSFWRSRVPVPNQTTIPRVDNEAAWHCFIDLDTTNEPNKLQFRYILALLLTRRRLLKLVDIENTAGGEYLVLRGARDGTVCRVWNPQLSDEQLAALEEQVATVLHG
jgi:hypothetical protein